MARAVEVRRTFPGSVHDAETCWYRVESWPQWVDGLEEVLEVSGEWPRVGSSVVWRSGPAGRGRVVERVVAYEPLAGQVVAVEDASVTARQSVSFAPAGGAEVEVALRLYYELKKPSVFGWIVDPLFIRRAFRTSLAVTLARFGAQLAGARNG